VHLKVSGDDLAPSFAHMLLSPQSCFHPPLFSHHLFSTQLLQQIAVLEEPNGMILGSEWLAADESARVAVLFSGGTPLGPPVCMNDSPLSLRVTTSVQGFYCTLARYAHAASTST
jgi:hypothetical protein